MTETPKRQLDWSIAVERELQDRACRCQEVAGRKHSECVVEANRSVREQREALR